MKQYIKGLVLLLICIMALSGCVADPYPEMTDAEYEVVVRYAASLLTRYNKGTADKLAFLDTEYTPEYLMAEAQNTYEQQEAPVQEQTETPGTTDAPQATDTSPATDPVTPETNDNPQGQTPDAQDGGNGDTQEQTPDVQGSDDGGSQEQTPDAQGGTDNTENPGETGGDSDPEPDDSTAPDTVQPATSYTGIGESGLQTLASSVRVEYTGYSVKSVYPDSQAQGAVAAAQGDKLLVVDFSVQNLTDTSVRFNTANRNPQFKLNINNSVQGFTMVTMIPNDLSGMDRELAPGERTDAVLLMEVPESLAKSVDTLDLVIMIRGEGEQTVKLE